MAHLTTVTLDMLSSPRMLEHALAPSGRLDGLSITVKYGLLAAFGQYLLDRGPNTKTDDPRTRFKYDIRDSDLDYVMSMFQEECTKYFD